MKQLILVTTLLLASAGIAAAAENDWPSYNRTLHSDRFVPAAEINRENVAGLQVACTYDTGDTTGFQTGPLVIDGILYGTTATDIFAIDASTCTLKWRTHEPYDVKGLPVNRGAAYLDGRLFRGTQDGRVIAYDAASGTKIWEEHIADPSIGESVPAAPIAWNGMVFIGNAGGDNKGVKGRMYALDASSGRQIWETYLVPRAPEGAASVPASTSHATSMESMAARTWSNPRGVPVSGGATWSSYTLDADRGLLYVSGGQPSPDFAPQLRPGANLFTNSVVVLDAKTGAYRNHYSLVPRDFHDWDVAAAAVLFTDRAGRAVMAVAPKDGNLYGYDLSTGKRLYRVPVTTVLNATKPLTPAGTRFCPGSQGGTEWNGPAYSPQTNLVYTGAVDWCTTVHRATDAAIHSVPTGQAWSGEAHSEHGFGKMDPPERWAGWLYASDAGTGHRAWRFESPAPILSGVTPTQGGLVFFGDMAGHVYALDAATGKSLWVHDVGGAVGGGVISYVAGGKQRLAFASGMKHPIWPTPDATAKIIVFALK